MRTNSEISEARSKIAGLLFEQCKHGQQTAALPPEMASCGQFVGDQARARAQRGAHGTAAALEVLADQAAAEFIGVTTRLVHYVEREWGANSCDLTDYDRSNVIKISETLHAVLKVPRAVAATEQLTRNLAQRLADSRKNGKGWSYFVGQGNGQIQELPTAFAVRALARHGSNDLAQSASYLLDCVKRGAKSAGKEVKSDIYVHIFSLYVLATSDIRGFARSDSELRSLFVSFWTRLKGLREDLEQNLEYWNDDAHSFYVRIPWQLYLLALAARLSPNRVLTTVAAESRLRSLIADVKSTNGFRYPHSGDVPSSRTNAILYEVLGFVDERSGGRWIGLFRMWNKVAEAWKSRSVKLTLFAVALVLMGYSVLLWITDPTQKLSGLATEFLAALLIAMVVVRRDA